MALQLYIIPKDIVDLTSTGARGSYVIVARKALERWRRYHTRSNVENLRQALRCVRVCMCVYVFVCVCVYVCI